MYSKLISTKTIMIRMMNEHMNNETGRRAQPTELACLLCTVRGAACRVIADSGFPARITRDRSRSRHAQCHASGSRAGGRGRAVAPALSAARCSAVSFSAD